MGISVSGLMYDVGGEGGGFKDGSLFFFAAGIMLVSAALIWFTTHNSARVYEEQGNSVTANNENAVSSKISNSGAFHWFLASMFIMGLGTYSILQILIFYIGLSSPIGASSFDIVMIRNSASIVTILASLIDNSLPF